MAILVGNNGEAYLLPDGIIEEPAASGQIFDNIRTLAQALNRIGSITRSNFGAVQSTIQSANSTFNVFAVVSHTKNSELIGGSASTTGKILFAKEGFVYNSVNRKLSTGKTIIDMSGGINSSLPEIDGKKWMACAIYDGTSSYSGPNGFRGILLWIFVGGLITREGTIIDGTASVTTTSDIFFPSIFGASHSIYRRVYQVVLNNTGGISASNVGGTAGWIFSTGQAASSLGYFTTSVFSADDGIWGFVIGGLVNGNFPGPYHTSPKGYGFGNYDRSDAGSLLYWNGSNIPSTNYVGFVFTGDA